MDNIVERLRNLGGWYKDTPKNLPLRAADEITRLRAENERLRLDKIEAFRIIRKAGRSDKAKAEAIAAALQETGDE